MKMRFIFILLFSTFCQTAVFGYGIFDLKGRAIAREYDGNAFRLKSGQDLSDEQIVFTGPKSTLSIYISKNSYLNLGRNSVMKFSKEKEKLVIHLFRGQIRVYHSEKDQNIKFVTPVKDMESKGKVTFVAEVYEYDEFPSLDLVMLRGSFYTDLHRIRSGMRFEAHWQDYEISEVGARFENWLVAGEKRFISDNLRSRNFNFEVEIEWRKVVPVIEVPKREIASVEVGEFEEPEVIPIMVHESIHDLISISAGKVMEKVKWFSEEKIKDIDLREKALSLAIEKVALTVFFNVKKILEMDLLDKADQFTEHLIAEDMTDLENNEIKDSLWVLTSQHVDSKVRKNINFDDDIYRDVKGDIEREIFYQIINKAKEWSYGQAKKKAQDSYQDHIKKNQLTPPEGIEELIERVAERTSTDFSNKVAVSISGKIASYQVNQAMRRARAIVTPVVQNKLKKMYQVRIYAEVERLLSDGRARVIASRKEEEFDTRKIQYQNQEFKKRRRQTIRNFRN